MHAFDILGDPVRRRILELLADGERPAGDVGAVVQARVRDLPAGGVAAPAGAARERLRDRARGGRPAGCTPSTPAPLREVDAWLEPYRQFWNQRLDALGTELARGKRERRPATPTTKGKAHDDLQTTDHTATAARAAPPDDPGRARRASPTFRRTYDATDRGRVGRVHRTPSGWRAGTAGRRATCASAGRSRRGRWAAGEIVALRGAAAAARCRSAATAPDEIELRLSPVRRRRRPMLEIEHATTIDEHEIGGQMYDAIYCMGGGYYPRLARAGPVPARRAARGLRPDDVP